MPEDMMNTKEVAEYLGIHEKQVYALIKQGGIPCTRVTGKWVFPRYLVDRWIATSAQKSAPAHHDTQMPGESLLAAGSNDPVLDVLLNSIKQGEHPLYIFSCSTGSSEGLRLLKEGHIHISWCHLFDPETGEYNVPYISEHFTEEKIAIVHLFYRELGFLMKHELKGTINDFPDIAKQGLTFINRQEGAGTRIFTDYRLQQHGIEPSQIAGYQNQVFTHMEVALAIASGEADTGIATVAAAQLFGLPFVPLIRESFDMVLYQETFFHPGVQKFIETLNSEGFRRRASSLGNYDFNESGKIVYSSS